jgi:ParB/RepB/Spo0J family partition protein
VRPRKDARDGAPTFELVCGHRRWAAAELAGLGEIPAIARELSDAEALEVQIVENLQREGVHPLDEAEGFELLRARHKLDVARIAERVGRSVPYVYDRLRLTTLHADAVKAFRSGSILAGHAVLLARLRPADQKRALDPVTGGVFEEEMVLFSHLTEPSRLRDERSLKTRSLRELQGWIDQHVKLDVTREDLPQLFPDLSAQLVSAKEKAEKLIPIAHVSFIAPDARDSEKVHGSMSWRRADGKQKSKACEHSGLGVVVVGPGRGETLRVCIDRKCKVHFPETAKKARKHRTTETAEKSAERDKQAAAKRRAAEIEKAKTRKIWEAAIPEMRKTLAAAMPSATAIASGKLGEELIEEASGYGSKASQVMPRPKTADGLVRFLAYVLLESDLTKWNAEEDFAKIAAKYGLDVMKILAPFAARAGKPVAGVCLKCGCTEEAACDGGCTWANKEQTLCSKCAPSAAITKPAKKLKPVKRAANKKARGR